MSDTRLAWVSALDIDERRAGAGPAASGSPDALAAWRTQAPFGEHPELWAARLEESGLSEDHLAALMAEPSEALASRLGAPPWIERIEGALKDESPPEPAWARAIEEAADNHKRGCLRLVTPFLRARLGAMGVAIDGARSSGVPVSASAILSSLLAHVGVLVEEPLARTVGLEVEVARARGLLVGPTPAARFDAFIDALSDPEVLPSFWERHPVLARAVDARLEDYAAASVAVLRDLGLSWREVASELDCASSGDLVAVQAATSETHGRGRVVCTLRFASGHRILYKPRSGKGDIAYAATLTWLAQRSPGLALPRAVRVVTRDGCSFHEFVEAAPCASREALQQYFERQGAHLMLLYVFFARDMHVQNLIAAGAHPVLVDLEALFQPRIVPSEMDPNPAGEAAVSSVLAPLFLPSKIAGNEDAPGVDISALGARSGQHSPNEGLEMTGLGTDEVRAARTRQAIDLLGPRPSVEGNEVDASQWSDAVLEGFTRTWEVLQTHKDDFVEGPLQAFRDVPVRVLLRSTDVYALILTMGFHPGRLTNPWERERLLDSLYLAVPTEPALLRFVAAERADLRRGDVPYFWMHPGTRDLIDTGGRVVSGVCDQAPFDAAVQRVRSLSDAELKRQRWLVQASFATMTAGEREIAWAPSHPAPSPARIARVAGRVAPGALIDRAVRIGDRLAELAIRSADRVGWMGLSLERSRDWMVRPARADLYAGAPGIALFLAHLGATTGEARFTDLARSALAAVAPWLERKVASREPAPVGIGGDLAGSMFAFAHLGSLWRDDDWLARAAAIAPALLARLPGQADKAEKAAKEHVDLLEGVAGCALGALALLRVRPGDPGALALVRACGDRLRASAVKSGDTVAWRTPLFPALPAGIAHGSSGVGLALLRIAEALAARGDEVTELRELARGAFAYDRTLFDLESGTWRDLRPGADAPAIASALTTWCHGAPGIGLVRLETLRGAPEQALREEAALAVRKTLSTGLGLNHSLCHGDFGNLETLFAASTLDVELDEASFAQCVRRVVESLDGEGPLCGVPRGLETPGLFVGLAGIGWALLRFAHPERLPNLMTFEPPTSTPFGRDPPHPDMRLCEGPKQRLSL